jgi:hypothetical protein
MFGGYARNKKPPLLAVFLWGFEPVDSPYSFV